MIDGLFLGMILGLMFGALITWLCLLSCWKDAEDTLRQEIELYEKLLQNLEWDLDYLERHLYDADKAKKSDTINPYILSSIRRTHLQDCDKCKKKK